MSLTATRETLAPFLQELERIAKTKADYVVAEKDVIAFQHPDDGSGVLTLHGPFDTLVPYKPTPHAINQLSDRLGVPREYARKCYAEKPQLWADNVNGWARDSKKNVLTRTLDGHVRAVVSDKFRVLDSYDLFLQAYGTLKDVDAEVTQASVTDFGNRFYLRAVVPGWAEVIKPPEGHNGISRAATLAGPDTIYPGAIIQNSETGQGGLSVSPFLFRRVCSNGLITDDVLRRVHLGERQELGYLSEEAVAKSSELVWLQVRDLIKATFNRDTFRELVAQFEECQSLTIKSPTKAVDNVVQAFGLSDADKQAIIDELVAPSYGDDPGRNVYGLINAVTNRAKHYADDPDRVAEFERIGGSILREPEMVLVTPKRK